MTDATTPPPCRVVDPPRAVIVDLSAALHPNGSKWANEVPLRVRAGGLEVTGQVPGTLYAWAQTTRGAWLCRVGFSVPAGRTHLEVDQWCPADAVRPVE